MNLLPAILFGGPPHAGKSVLFYSLAKALRDRGIPHHALRACPDGEGNWFHELDQDKVRLIRVKGAWTRDFVKVHGLLPLAELYSTLSAMSTIDADGPVIKGTFAGLERGSMVHGPLFDALVERIALLFSSYSLEELEKTKLDMAPVDLVANLDTFLQRWAPNTRRW